MKGHYYMPSRPLVEGGGHENVGRATSCAKSATETLVARLHKGTARKPSRSFLGRREGEEGGLFLERHAVIFRVRGYIRNGTPRFVDIPKGHDSKM